MNRKLVLIFSCPDKKGIVAAVSKVLFENDGNIVESNQHSAKSVTNPHFYMRIVFELDSIFAEKNLANIKIKLNELKSIFGIEYELNDTSVKKNAAIFVSKEDHCLYELLWQTSSGDIFLNIGCILSNHKVLSSVANFYNVPFIYIPSNFAVSDNDDDSLRLKQERFILNEIAKYDIDFIILAKYMRILSPGFINLFNKKIINIHHSFLPSFPGAKPYLQAYEKGVKIIGATAHFVNEKLDDGPIIEQDVIRINHEDDAEELKKKGKIIERTVLARAVKFFVEDRIIQYGNKTIVFA
ncbi:MAG: formyltetrahydrofolate deformylase [Candidatus Acidulodesulfobacterium acidiphilum]|uniref:Formyltetrahydrofolate deformylase n=1 Tax=Candidatus Acidulodesulfobacterium acidiphilum TaxID=2597224 RepID=A0A520X735_9DELT|nr:MAG: formyltetrahydrofolate deformylase [Candidatus Acidulodesulfobacterium acidiphilum]